MLRRSERIIQYLNRDHVISASVSDEELVITTTAGRQITVRASRDELAELVEQLVSSVQSNFVTIRKT